MSLTDIYLLFNLARTYYYSLENVKFIKLYFQDTLQKYILIEEIVSNLGKPTKLPKKSTIFRTRIRSMCDYIGKQSS
jgi:hypothetical protein